MEQIDNIHNTLRSIRATIEQNEIYLQLLGEHISELDNLIEALENSQDN